MSHKYQKTVSLLTVFFFFLSQTAVFALPQGEQVVSGSASFDRSQANTLNINQTTDQLIANYQSFSVAQPEAVHFNQPGSSSVALNRVVGGSPSSILGTMTSNGKIFLVNPNGILFGQNAQLDMGGLIASTLDINNDDFLAGRYTFTGQGGTVINQGMISAPGGYVALLGSAVENSGMIEANLGSVVLASGKAMTLSLDPQGLMNVVIDEATSANLTNADAAASNSGVIEADGGRVIVTAKQLGSIFDKAVNNSGIIEARSLASHQGEVFLTTEHNNGKTVNAGTIDVRGAEAGADGGLVELRGAVLDFAQGTILNSPFAGGNPGTIIFGSENFVIDDVWSNSFEGYNGAHLVIEADQDVNFNLSDGLLALHNFDDENFIIRAVRNIKQNFDRIHTCSGNIELYSAEGFIDLDAEIKTYGGDVVVEALQGNVYQGVKSDVFTAGGSFRGYAGNNYTMNNGSSIDAQSGDIDLYAGNNVILGTSGSGVDLKTSKNIFITAENGSITQYGGRIRSAENVMLSANTGITGAGVNGGIEVSISNISAVNKKSGDIKIADTSELAVLDLSHLTGLNIGVTGQNGITNDAAGGAVDIYSRWEQYIEAPIQAHGNINLKAAERNLTIRGNGNITIIQDNDVQLGAIEARSTSHDTSVWSNNNTIDVEWEMPEKVSGADYQFTADAGKQIKMEGSTVINTNHGDAVLTAKNDISLTLIDAGLGDVAVTSQYGNIIDSDKGVVPADYDIIARNIQLNAPNGSVGFPGGAEDQIDIGVPLLDFSFLFDQVNTTQPDSSADSYDSQLTSSGDWLFSTSYTTPEDSANWWFHVAAIHPSTHQSLTPAHLGPFFIDTTAPVISADYLAPNGFGWHNQDVTVDFMATDNLSGFAPNGNLTKDLNSETVTAEGVGLIVTSDGVFDRAGNQAVPVQVSLNIDKTAPVITAGNPSGQLSPDGQSYVTDVTVPFSATDNLSGFAPNGDLNTDLDPKTTSGVGPNLIVTSDGIFDLAGNFAAGLPAGPFTVTKATTPGNPNGNGINTNVPLTFESFFNEFKVYYEILKPNQFVSVEPATKLGLYAYHPIVETDMSAFDDIELDSDAYEFIDEQLEKKKSSLMGEE